MRNNIQDEYFNWLYNFVCGESFDRFSKLLTRLHETEFRYSIRNDQNRASDGVGLRRRFCHENNCVDRLAYLAGPCSVLEMLIALSIRCEESIMDDTFYGDRTTQWFWNMIVNLGLGGMIDQLFDIQEVDTILERFLNREYEPDGRGGLFTIKNCEDDLRDVEIWYQLCWYLDTIV